MNYVKRELRGEVQKGGDGISAGWVGSLRAFCAVVWSQCVVGGLGEGVTAEQTICNSYVTDV